jgi:GT2 family glycosyltransferase
MGCACGNPEAALACATTFLARARAQGSRCSTIAGQTFLTNLNITPFFSVIIPTCHRNDLLAKCLDCLAPGKQTGGDCSGNRRQKSEVRNPISDPPSFTYEVIVTDDGSKSTAREMIEKNYPWARWIEGPRRGPAANRNNGAKHAQGEWLVFTDDDCLPDSAFLSSFWAAAMENDDSVLEGKTSPTGVRTRVDMECPVNETGGYLWSCNMAIHKNLFFELDGFDAHFPGPAMEDVDFRTRLLKAGKTFKFIPSALVLHPWQMKKGFPFLKLHSQSRGYFISKHPEAADSVSIKSLGLDLVRKLVKQLPPVALECRGRGLGRELLLTFYTTYALIKYTKRSNWECHLK